MNRQAHDELDQFIERVEGLRVMNEEIAKAAEKPVADVVRKTAKAGQAPDGKAWAARKDGGKALEGAAEAIKSAVRGTRIFLTIKLPWVFHNWGAGGSSTSKEAKRSRARAKKQAAESGVKSKFHAPRRQILPIASEGTPPAILEAIRAKAVDVFNRMMRR